MAEVSIDEAMKAALRCHESGRLTDADGIYQNILKTQPDHFDALRLRGVIARQQGQFDSAVELIERAARVDPGRAEGHYNLADVLRCQGKLDAAIVEYKIAIQCNPSLTLAHLHLGKVLHDQNRRAEAKIALEKAIELKPDWAEPHNALGNVLWDDRKLEEAINAYRKAVKLKPDYLAAQWSLGKILSAQGRMEAAISCFHTAVHLNPKNAKGHYYLGRMLERAGHREAACKALAEAVRLRPDAEDWRFILSSMSGDGAAATMPADHIRNLFNDYADTFDEHLVEHLHYRAPEMIRDALLNATSTRDWDVLDLGCGTGLSGQAIRPLARKLVGVDLAQRMIDLARKRGIYDELINGELMETLHARAGTFDVIVAADVLIYVGDLSRLMPCVADALRANGLFAFTIEKLGAGEGFFLHGEQRFAHSIQYVREMAARTGLSEVSISDISLRKHADSDVAGCLVVLRKSAEI
jgi:predicted TPR repeat methyltransferase